MKELAIHGGEPVRSTFLPYGRQAVEEQDIQAVVDVLRSDWLTTGPNLAAFEEAFAERCGAKHAVAYSSGTAALHGSIFAAGIGPGDETITTPLTFCATSNCVLYQGGRPHFADVRRDTLNLDPEMVARKVCKNTKAIIPVAYAGQPADLDAFMDLSQKHDLCIIEDACHALGATYKGRKTGSIAHMTVFSFHPVKHVTTGEGGMVTTNDERLASRLRRFRSHGIESDARQRQAAGQWQYDMIDLGYNYRLTDIGSVLGNSQLRRLEANLKRRREIAQRYDEAFLQLPGVVVPGVRRDVEHAYHLYPIEVADDWDRAEVYRALRAENIGVNVHYIPVYLHSYYKKAFGYKGGECPNAEDAYGRLISLPMFHGMTDQDVADVIEAVGKVMFGLRKVATA